MKRCAECEGTLEKTKTLYRVRIGPSTTAEVSIPARECSACGEVYTSGADMEKAEFLVATQIAASNYVSGETFRFMRRALGKQSNELAELLDVAPETITRWEKGDKPVSPIAWSILALLVTDKANGRDDTRRVLSSTRHPTRLPKLFKVA